MRSTERKTPMLVSFLAVGLNLLLNWIFTFRLGWGHRGLAFSTGCIATFNFLLLYPLMRRQLQGLESRRMLAMLGKCAGLRCAGGGVRGLVRTGCSPIGKTQSLCSKLAALLATIIAGALAFAGCGVLLHIEELKELRDAVRRRRKADYFAPLWLILCGIALPRMTAGRRAKHCGARVTCEVRDADQIAGVVKTDEIADPGKSARCRQWCTHRP